MCLQQAGSNGRAMTTGHAFRSTSASRTASRATLYAGQDAGTMHDGWRWPADLAIALVSGVRDAFSLHSPQALVRSVRAQSSRSSAQMTAIPNTVGGEAAAKARTDTGDARTPAIACSAVRAGPGHRKKSGAARHHRTSACCGRIGEPRRSRLPECHDCETAR